MESYPSYILSQSYASCFDQYFSWISQSMLYSHLFCFKELFDKVLRVRNKNPNLSNQRWTIKEASATSAQVSTKSSTTSLKHPDVQCLINVSNVYALTTKMEKWLLLEIDRLYGNETFHISWIATFFSHVNRKWRTIIRPNTSFRRESSNKKKIKSNWNWHVNTRYCGLYVSLLSSLLYCQQQYFPASWHYFRLGSPRHIPASF